MNFRQVARSGVYEPYAELWNLEYPDDRRTSAEVASNFITLLPGTFEEHWTVEVDGRLAAIVSSFDRQCRRPPETLEADIVVRPEWEERLMPALLDHVEGIACRAESRGISAWTSDLRKERLVLLEQRGFRRTQTVPVTRLDITAFDPTPFEWRVCSAHERGFRLATIAELEADGFDWVEPLYHSTWDMVQDVPQTHEPTQPTLEQYRQMLQDETVYARDLMFVALEGERIVAYSRVSPSVAMPELVRTGLSGTVRSHRRQGLVSALKVLALGRLKERGFQLLQTDNDETNPMYKLNLDLGFRDIWCWMLYEKSL